MSFIVNEKIEEYAESVTRKPPRLLEELELATHRNLADPEMLTGRLEGRLLKFIVQILGAKRVLEVGMFTGYGTLSMAEGMPEDGRIWTCEQNSAAIQFAKSYFERSPDGRKIEILEGPALKSIADLRPPFDFIFIDADKPNHPLYYEEAIRLLRSGGVVAMDNALWSGRVLDPTDAKSKALADVNRTIAEDSRVEGVLLTVRDGIHLARKK